MGSIADRVTIAVIGAGVIGRKHADLVNGCSNATLAAVVDPSEIGVRLASAYGCRHFFTVEELMKSRLSITAAIICTPNDTHASIGIELAKRGIHLLVEKPFTTSVEDGQKLLDACLERGVVLAVGHHRRFHAQIQTAKKALSTNEIGQLIGVSGLWTTLKTVSYFCNEGAWRAGTSGGVVLINLIHEIDLLQYFLGPIQRVYAEKSINTRKHAAEEGVALTLRFESGIVATFLALDNTPSPFNIERGTGENAIFPYSGKDCYRFFGTHGVLSVPDNTQWKPESHEKGWYSAMQETSLVSEQGDPYERQLHNFLGAIKDGSDVVCTGEDGLAAVAVCVAIKQSLITNMPVKVQKIHIS